MKTFPGLHKGITCKSAYNNTVFVLMSGVNTVVCSQGSSGMAELSPSVRHGTQSVLGFELGVSSLNRVAALQSSLNLALFACNVWFIQMYSNKV